MMGSFLVVCQAGSTRRQNDGQLIDGGLCRWSTERMPETWPPEGLFRLLGPVRLDLPDRLVASLLLTPGRAVAVDQLVDRIWGDRPPARARNVLATYAARVRRILEPVGAPELRYADGGYRIDCEPDRVDLHRARALAAEARLAGTPADAEELLRHASGYWQPNAVAGLTGGWADRLREILRRERVDVLTRWAEATLAAGRPGEAIEQLRLLVAEEPTAEAPAARLIATLAAAGSRAEAVEQYERLRSDLDAALGVRPSARLRELHAALLRNAAVVAPAEPARPAPTLLRGNPGAPAHLPAAVPGFVGRDAELAALDDVLDRARAEPIGTTMAVLSGMPGAGKTALAVHWAHRIRRHFPDGQLFAALRGFRPAAPPIEPSEAVGALLRTLRVPTAAVPAGLDDRAALLRELLVDRRVLLLLDDAASVDQVRPLLPAGAHCLVLVTSRDLLSGLIAAEGAHPVPVEPFAPADGADLLAARLGATRVGADRDAARDISAFCAGLPLALGVAAAQAITRPRVPLRRLAAELRAARDALGALAADDPAVDVRTVFSSSYRMLTDGPAQLFRLLSLHPGVDIGEAAMASLAGVPPSTVRRWLAELTRAHMLSEPQPGRWTLHDLLRAYATELLADSERDAALTRLLDHYLHAAYHGGRLLNPHRDPLTLDPPASGVTGARFGSDHEALAWFETEWPALPTLVVQATATGHDQQAWQLAWALADYVHRRAAWPAWAQIQRAAVTATAHLGDRPAQAHAHRLLGIALLRLGRLDEARTELEHAHTGFAELGDPNGQALTHRGLGRVAAHGGDHGEALARSQAALECFTESGNRRGQAGALNSAGWNLAALGEYAQALPLCTEALTIQRELGDRFGEANTWDTLGRIQSGLGRYDEAITSYTASLVLARKLGDRFGEADSLGWLARTHDAAGHFAEAERARQESDQLRRRLSPHPQPAG
jgi:DNA-binding SARP family transcriptional activator/DNA-binding transcriptional ArsR family regulator